MKAKNARQVEKLVRKHIIRGMGLIKKKCVRKHGRKEGQTGNHGTWNWFKKVLQGDERSAARLISMIEEGLDEGYEAVSLLFPYTGKAHIIGVTGAPGCREKHHH